MGLNLTLHLCTLIYSFLEDLYDVPTSVTVILSICYGSISVLAIVGNSLVMWIVTTTRRMQNMTNFFIANLALADIIIGLFVIPFQVVNIFYLYILHIRYRFSHSSFFQVPSSLAAEVEPSALYVRLLSLRSCTLRKRIGVHAYSDRDR